MSTGRGPSGGAAGRPPSAASAGSVDPPEPAPAGSASPPGPVLGLDALRAAIDRGEVDEVIVALPDFHGRLAACRQRARRFLEEVATHGFGACAYLVACDLDMEPVAGAGVDATARGFGDVELVPDLATLTGVPWEPAAALVLADAREPDGGGPVAVAPRQVLIDQLALLEAEHGLAVDCGTELELTAFAGSYADAHAAGHRDLSPLTRHVADYALAGLEALDPYARELRAAATAMGLEVESARAEVHPGQYEVVFRHREALRACDDHARYKAAAKVLAGRAGIAVTFMAKVDAGEGSSCHVHLSLRDADGRNVLAAGPDDAAPADPTHGCGAVLARVLAGQAACLADLALLWAPSPNAYRRLQPGAFAPCSVAWGHDNRLAALRVVGRGGARRIEHRVPGADANPYLVLAGIVAACRHGLAGDAGPLRAPVRGLPDPDVDPLPRDLTEALARWRASPLPAALLGRDVADHVAAMAAHELDRHRRGVPDLERAHGFERA